MTAAGGGEAGDRSAMAGTGVSITPYMMAAGDEQIIADRLHAVLSKPPVAPVKTPAPPAADLSGGWDVKIQYAAGRIHPPLPAPAEGGGDRGRAPGRLRHPRSHRIDRRRRRAAAQQRRRTGRRRVLVHVHRQDRRRPADRHARHGRVSRRDVHGDAAGAGAAAGMMRKGHAACDRGRTADGDGRRRGTVALRAQTPATPPGRPPSTTCSSRAATSSMRATTSTPCATSPSPAGRSRWSRRRFRPPTPARRSTWPAST